MPTSSTQPAAHIRQFIRRLEDVSQEIERLAEMGATARMDTVDGPRSDGIGGELVDLISTFKSGSMGLAFKACTDLERFELDPELKAATARAERALGSIHRMREAIAEKERRKAERKRYYADLQDRDPTE